MAVKNWSSTAASNVSGLTGINWNEGMNAAAVNDSARGTLAQIADWYAQIKGGTIYPASIGGTANAITLTCSPTVDAYATGQRFLFKATNTNTTTTTINVDGLGAKTIKFGGANLTAGAITSGDLVVVSYDGTDFQLLSASRITTTIQGDVSTLQTDLDTAETNITTNATNISTLTTNTQRSVNFIGRPNSKIAIFGDSITAQNTSTNAQSNQARGYMVQAHALSMNRFYYDSTLNFGVAGDTVQDMIDRISDVVASDPARVIFLGGTNDLSGGDDAPTIFTKIQSVLDTLNDAGIPVDIIPVLPRTYNMDATKRKVLNHLNHLILNEVGSRNPNFYGVIPANIPLIDKNSSTGDTITGGFFPEADGKFLHPMDYGATLMGQVISSYYSVLFPTQPIYFNNQADAYDATYNPYGYINLNPFMTGTSGTAGTGVTGSVATNYTIERNSGSTFTATASKGTDSAPQNGVTQIITLGASGTGVDGENIRMKQTHFDFNFSVFTAGDKFVLEIDVEQANLTNVKNISALISSGTTSTWYGLSPSGITGDRTVASCRRLIKTHAFTLSSSAETVDVFLNIQADCSGTAPSGTITIRSFSVRKIP